jgi:hypothetical protein
VSDIPKTPGETPKFDFSAYPSDTLFYDRREGLERRDSLPAPPPVAPPERRAKKERRRRIDPTTFEKQYTPDELEFMTAMQRFKVLTGKAFPTYSEVLTVARSIGYRKVGGAPFFDEFGEEDDDDNSLTPAGGAGNAE